MNVVRGLAELVEVVTYGPGRDASVAEVGDRRHVAVPLRELLAVLAEDQSVMNVLRRLESQRTGERLLQLGVRAMIGPANHVRDAEVVIVDDAREVVGRGTVGAQQGDVAEAKRPVLVLGACSRRRFAVAFRALALRRRSLVPVDPEPA